jgi:Ca2+-transporting ATPase
VEREAAWHTLEPEEVLLVLDSDGDRGLQEEEASRRFRAVGPNALPSPPPTPWWRLLLGQFTDFMVLVLLAATGISFALGEAGDALTILAIVVMNAILGFLQEFRAERAVDSLKALTAPTARVCRGSSVRVIDAQELVPGDVVILEAGDRVPADARLLEAWALEADEAALTGESAAVAKRVAPIPDPGAALGDRRSMVYMGTNITRGRGRAVVVATGPATEMGRIAHLINAAGDDPSPLQRRLEHLGKVLVGLSLVIVLAVVATGILRGEPLYQMFLTGVSLAVAAIPEGLPAIVTVALALGIQRMIRNHAIVRRLPAVETLGSVTVIASDKTGTLTKNRMTVVAAYVDGEVREVSAGPSTRGAPRDRTAGLRLLLQGCVLASTATLDGSGDDADGHGDPTELALLRAAADQGIEPAVLRQHHRLLGEIPFESERRRMAVAVEAPDHRAFVYVKGAPDVVLDRARFEQVGDRVMPLDAARRQRALQANEQLAGRALRVLAVAYKPLRAAETEYTWEEGLIFVGLVGMIDPPRPEAIQAVRICGRAGIRTVMITGDHPKTAEAIARQTGILPASAPPGAVVTGRQLDQLDEAGLAAIVDEARVFARVSPPHKLRVVRALKGRGHIVAMTGDGVNDAPAVKEADIGVAMGITGTDVTKEASAMILTDDNFATIVRAVREGRAIYDNIRKFIRYLLSCNVGEVLVMFLAALLGLPLPLLPIQILFVNLVTDGLPAMALGVDPPAPDVMDRPPRPPRESIFARGLGTKIAIRGILIGVATLLVFQWGLTAGGMGLREARTLALATLILSQLFHVFDARAEDGNFLAIGLWSNPWAVLAVASSIVMLLAVVYVPGLRELFKTDPLTVTDWIVVVLASGFIQIASAIRYVLVPTGSPRPMGAIGWQDEGRSS